MKEESLLRKLPTIIAVFSTLFLCLSIAYDFGYFFAFGVSFAEVPTTLSDHLRSSLVWTPRVLLIIFVVFALELLNRRIEQGLTEEEIIQGSSNPKFTAWFRDSPKYPIIAVALCAPLTLFFNIKIPIVVAWQFSLTIIWFILHRFFFGHKRIIERTSKGFRILSCWIPAILIFMAFRGIIAANEIKDSGEPRYVFELEESKITKVLARTFDEYYMLWDEKKETVLWLSVGKVSSFYPEHIETESNKSMQPTNDDG